MVPIIGHFGVKTLGDIESKDLKMKPTLDPETTLYITLKYRYRYNQFPCVLVFFFLAFLSIII